MSNLVQRIITGLLGASVMVFAISFNEWAFGIVFILIAALTLSEFFSLTRKAGYHPYTMWAMTYAILLFSLVFLAKTGFFKDEILWILPALLALSLIFPLYASKEKHPINDIALTLLGVLYIALPFVCLVVIAFRQGDFSYQIVLGALLAQWANDTGAFFAGKTFGKRKLFERISPNKTWEGAIGGGVFGLITMYVWSQYFSELAAMEWIIIGLIVAIFGGLGDLVESLLKRTLVIKDSGTILKGHGGFLDRFDGFIIAIPFVTTYVMLIN